MKSENKSFNSVKEFHEAFGHVVGEKPTPIPVDVAIKRSVWKAEEIIEFLHASVGGKPEDFYTAVTELKKGIDAAVHKQLLEGEYKDKSDFEITVRQMDALTDISYFNYGDFVIAGVDPQPLFDIVQEANMGKLDRKTGKPIIRETDGKIMKPEYWEAEFAPEPKLREAIQLQINSDDNSKKA